MASQTSSPSSWHYTALTVLAGVGAGYVLGVVSGRWIWTGQRSRPRPSHSSTPRSQGQPSSSISNLVSTIGELTAEVGRLREVVATAGLISGRSYSRRSMTTVDSTADFVSARGDSDSDADFFETEEPEKVSETAQQLVDFDVLGKSTLESREVCTTLIEKIQSAMEEREDDVELLWRLARVLVHLSLHHQQNEDKEEERRLLSQAAGHAQKALELNGESWQAHQWYAVAIGSVVKFEGTQEKISRGHEYKEHIDRAIELRPEEPILHYLSGRWCFEVASLSWLEKKAAAALFATLPESTYDNALQYFMKTEELNPGTWKANMLMIAKCHLKSGDVDSALEWLNKAHDVPTVTTEDETSQQEIEDLLMQHQTENNNY